VLCLVHEKTLKETKSTPYSANMYGSHSRYRGTKVLVQLSGAIRILTPNFYNHMNIVAVVLISNFRHVLNVVRFLLGNSSASEYYMPVKMG